MSRNCCNNASVREVETEILSETTLLCHPNAHPLFGFHAIGQEKFLRSEAFR